jgi:putative CocE/NonD family hydrolase
VPLPTLHIGGWFDIFAPNSLAQYRRQLDHSDSIPGTTPRLIVGPWTHTNLTGAFPEVSFGMAASAGLVNGIGDLSSIHTAWFDAALKDDPRRLDEIPPVLLYFMGENTWHGFDALPEPSVQRSWYLGAGGSLDDEPGTTGAADYLYDPLNPVPTVGGATMIHGAFPAGPATQAAVEARDDVLVFTSPPVEEKTTSFRRDQGNVLRLVQRRGHGLRGPALQGCRERDIHQHCRRHCPGLLAGKLRGHRLVLPRYGPLAHPAGGSL